MDNDKSVYHISNSLKDKLVLFLPVLWIAMIVFVYMDLGFVGMYLTIIHGMINVILGLAEGEKINKKLSWIFVVGWGILMFVAITGMIYYYYYFGNNIPSFTIMGMHPSAFYFYAICWIGNLVYLGGFLYIFKDTWLPEKKWNDFVDYAASLNNDADSQSQTSETIEEDN
ncbi:hypothetical protein [Fundicoccus culcitae]|uniref:Uncharacterized protein n=1 Tax=Fundicoccus culcitae TaxID=2969821 RepID=A0ABY5P8K8_9LACT|nr:hypothetical protein [Fundicoccus culcitae]UUX35077.1 hypothetical protein NRE15_05390 [Fundicoccus culcitae]